MARNSLAASALAASICHSGVAPAWAVGAHPTTPTAWPQGVYRALCTATPTACGASRDVEVIVRSTGAGNELVWPDCEGRTLTFYAGPRDEWAQSMAARQIALQQSLDWWRQSFRSYVPT
jgi:hypothetical protein